MTISIARLTAHSGVKYLLKTTMHDDVPLTSADATGYYMKAGTPPGRWLGRGLAGIGRESLDPVTSDDATAVFTDADHPDTHQPLGHHHGATTIAHRNGEEIQRVAVAGFDLTFSIPKSISVLWALAPRDVQQQILAAHHDAVNQVLEWLEESAIHTRTGRGGVAHVATKGAVAAAFDHWESRARDPQLHTHVVVANRVQRATDGAWTTLDSRTLYKATVAASEHYNGLLFDRLQERVGAVPGFRAPTSRVRNARHELVGVDDALIHEFSNRSHRIDEEKDRLVASWTQEHGRDPSSTTVLKLRQQATLSTRQAKGKEPRPLSDLASGWRSRAQRLGFEPAVVVRHTINHSHESPVTAADLTESWVTAAATATYSTPSPPLPSLRASRSTPIATTSRSTPAMTSPSPATPSSSSPAPASTLTRASSPTNSWSWTPGMTTADLPPCPTSPTLSSPLATILPVILAWPRTNGPQRTRCLQAADSLTPSSVLPGQARPPPWPPSATGGNRPTALAAS